MVGKVANILLRAGDEIVERENLPAFRDQPVAKMRTEKSRPTSDYRTH